MPPTPADPTQADATPADAHAWGLYTDALADGTWLTRWLRVGIGVVILALGVTFSDTVKAALLDVADAAELPDTLATDLTYAAIHTVDQGLWIVAAIAATVVTMGGRWARLLSVAHRFRWRFVPHIAAVAAPVLGLAVVADLAVNGNAHIDLEHDNLGWVVARLAAAVGLLAVSSSGQELLMHAFAMLHARSLLNHRLIVIPAAAVAAFFFMWGHHVTHPWLITDLLGFSVVMLYLMWATGGVEASCVVHTLTNLAITAGVLITGSGVSFESGDPDANVPLGVAIDVGSMIVLALILPRAIHRAQAATGQAD